MLSRLALVLLSVFLPCTFVFAQTVGNFSNTLTIQAPAQLAPHNTVQLTVHDAFVDLSGSTITWYVNGVQISSGQGNTDLTVSLGSLGTPTNVSVSAATPSGLLTAQASLTPTQVDLLWQSDSYVPPFYRGRALPSPESTISFAAVPHLVANGRELPASQLTYTWKINGAAQRSGSGAGKTTLQMTVPSFTRGIDVEVSAATADGTLYAIASETIPVVAPVVLLYNDHPLFGIEFGSALPANSTTPANELSLLAVPFFAPNGGAGLSYSWTVNHAAAQSDTGTDNEITINAQRASALATIGLEATGTRSFLDLQGQWSIAFNTTVTATGVQNSSAGNVFFNNQ